LLSHPVGLMILRPRRSIASADCAYSTGEKRFQSNPRLIDTTQRRD